MGYLCIILYISAVDAADTKSIESHFKRRKVVSAPVTVRDVPPSDSEISDGESDDDGEDNIDKEIFSVHINQLQERIDQAQRKAVHVDGICKYCYKSSHTSYLSQLLFIILQDYRQ